MRLDGEKAIIYDFVTLPCVGADRRNPVRFAKMDQIALTRDPLIWISSVDSKSVEVKS